jgi:AraC-like DNA-binding protein
VSSSAGVRTERNGRTSCSRCRIEADTVENLRAGSCNAGLEGRCGSTGNHHGGTTATRGLESKDIASDRPDLSVQQISDHLGYADSPSFCRFFKRKTGITPSEYIHQFN